MDPIDLSSDSEDRPFGELEIEEELAREELFESTDFESGQRLPPKNDSHRLETERICKENMLHLLKAKNDFYLEFLKHCVKYFYI